MRVTSATIGQSDKARARERRLYDLKLQLIRVRGSACEFCGARGVRLDSHHILGRGNKVAGEWADHPALLVLLCAQPGQPDTCHKRVHVPGSEQETWALQTAHRRLGDLGDDGVDALRTLEWLMEKRASSA